MLGKVRSIAYGPHNITLCWIRLGEYHTGTDPAAQNIRITEFPFFQPLLLLRLGGHSEEGLFHDIHGHLDGESQGPTRRFQVDGGARRW